MLMYANNEFYGEEFFLRNKCSQRLSRNSLPFVESKCSHNSPLTAPILNQVNPIQYLAIYFLFLSVVS